MAEDLSTYPASRIALTRDGKLAINGGQILNSAGADITPMLEVLDDLTAAQITALAALSTTEIGYLDAVTPGTTSASKVVIVDANKRLDALVIADGGLALGTGAGTAVGATAAELNLAADGNANGTHTIGIAAQAGDDIALTIQLKTGAGGDLAKRASLRAYLSSAADGEGVTATGPDGGMAAGTDGACFAVVAGKMFELQSEADGDIDLVVTEAGAGTWYLVLVKPNGDLLVSGAITFS